MKNIISILGIMILTFIIASISIAAEWTIMVYCDADNNLDLAGVEDLNELEYSGSTVQVNMIFLLDRYGWNDTKLYYVLHDPAGSPGGTDMNIVSQDISASAPWLASEEDMGNPQTLQDFVVWTIQNYPASHYLLSIWDHGSGIFRGEEMGITKGECWDDHGGVSGEYIDLAELRDVLAAAYSVNGNQKIDIVGHDVCVLGQIETHYQMRDYVKIGIASEESEPGDGWEYGYPFFDLKNDPQMSPQLLASKIVEYYCQRYGPYSYMTQAAIDLSTLESSMIPQVNTFSKLLSYYMYDFQSNISNARYNTEYYNWSCGRNPELYHFAQLISIDPNLPDTLRSAAENLMSCYPSVVINECHGNYSPNAHGMTIWFPDDFLTNSCKPDYLTKIEFSQESWDEFLAMYDNPQAPYEGPTWYVSTTGNDTTGNGSPQFPFATIQKGINTAESGDTVLVCPGVYYENIDFLGKGIVVASQFILNGNTSKISQTIIDGSQPDHPDTGSVVLFHSGEDSTSKLVGFTLRNGTGTQVPGMPPESTAACGGGVCCYYGSSPTISNNIIVSDSAAWGGGIGCERYSSAKIINNRIINNVSLWTGGGIYCYESNPTIVGNEIVGNKVVQYYGGGIYCQDTSDAQIIDNVIDSNSAGLHGGGIYIDDSSPMVTKNNILRNTAVREGGGIYCWLSGTIVYYPLIDSNNISNNNSLNGAGICCRTHNNVNCGVRITRNTIYENTVDTVGGGIFCDGYAYPTIDGNTLDDNVAFQGGGLYFTDDAHPVVKNNIVSNSQGEGLFCSGNSNPTISYNDVWGSSKDNFYNCQPGIGDTTWGKNYNETPCDGFYNIIRNPLFADPSNHDYHLTENSLCIDAGDPKSPKDPDSTIADIGRYYYHQEWHGPIWYVNASGSDTCEGAPWCPFATIQKGIDVASDGDTVLVAPGYYAENINFKSKGILVGSYYIFDQDTATISHTIIDGSSPSDPDSGSVVRFVSGEDSISTLKGFTITGGTGTAWNGPGRALRQGGGIYCFNSSPTIINNSIIDNHIPGAPGGARWEMGGGIGCWGASSPFIGRNLILNNSSPDGGDGIGLYHAGSPIIVNNTLSNHVGDGICMWNNCVLSVKNNIIVNNDGHGISFVNCPYYVSGITYNDVWNNAGGNFDAEGYPPPEIGDTTWGVNYNGTPCDSFYNIIRDPEFVTPGSDYHIKKTSPCIDAGDPSSPKDPDGTIADIGRYYYYHPSSPSCPYLFVWDGSDFVEDNTILTASEDAAQGEVVTDFYKIQKPLVAKEGKYHLQIKELEQEKSFIDHMELIKIDHPQSCRIGVAPDGKIFEMEESISPISAVDDKGVDQLDKVREADGNVYRCQEPGSLTLTYSLPQKQSGVIAVGGMGNVTKDRPCDIYPYARRSSPKDNKTLKAIRVEVQKEHGSWIELAVAPARTTLTENFWVLDSPNLDLGEQFKVRISWNHEYSADELKYFVVSKSKPDITPVSLISANHSTKGSVEGLLKDSDNQYVTLTPGETIDLSFSAEEPLSDGMTRDFVLKTVGYYIVSYEEQIKTSPDKFVLLNNFPNPFNPTTQISFSLPKTEKVTLGIFNLLGQKIITLLDKEMQAGNHTITWDGKNDRGEEVSSGVYFYRFQSGEYSEVKKMLLLK